MTEPLAVLPAAAGAPDEALAYDLLYWEVFGREKKKKGIRITFLREALLYVPYWVGYVHKKQWDICVLDALTGKVDFTMKESILKGLLRNAD